ncbi:unnamed protein product [Discosporangium mesarthrocarpum]
MDDLTGGLGRVLQADVRLDPAYVCEVYDSCKSVAIVGETTAMQSGLASVLRPVAVLVSCAYARALVVHGLGWRGSVFLSLCL